MTGNNFDPMVANPGRLGILTSLAVEERQEFVQLRRSTRLTDGNLASHAKRLAGAGLVKIEKSFRGGKPVTQLFLTPEGRSALEAHARRVMSAISHRRVKMELPPQVEFEPPVEQPALQTVVADDWVD